MDNLRKALETAERKALCLGKTLIKSPDAETETQYERAMRQVVSIRSKLHRAEMIEIVALARATG